MFITTKLAEIYNFAKLDIENLRNKEEKLLDSNAGYLQDSAEAFKNRCGDYAVKFDENRKDFKDREIYKSRLSFVDETGKSPSVLRADQTRCLKKLREYLAKEIDQADTVSALDEEYKRIQSDVRSMEHSRHILSETKETVSDGTEKTVKAAKNFLGLAALLSALISIGVFFLFSFSGILHNEEGNARIFVSLGISIGVFIVLFIASAITLRILRSKNTEKLQLLIDSTEESYLNTYLEKYNDAANRITDGLQPALESLTARNTAFLEELTEYYLTFLPDNIVYIINPVIDGLESGLSFGEAVWRSDDRLQADTKHSEIMNKFRLIGEHLYSLEDLQKDQITAQKKQLAALNAQTAAVAANTAATLAQNAEIGRQKDALNRMAEEIRNYNNN